MFIDSQGRTFPAVLTLATSKKLNQIGVDLNDFPAVLDKIVSDPELWANSLWIIHEAALTAAGITAEQFGGMLDGDTLDAATESLRDAIVNFSRPSIRAAMRTLVDKTREIDRQAGQQMLTAAQNLSVDAVLSQLNNSAGSSPENAAAPTPTPAP